MGVSKRTMKAIGVEKYGPIENLESRTVDHPGSPQGRQILVRVQASSVNPIDVKIRGGVYDDTPGYYERVAGLRPMHITGLDGAGIVEEAGPDARKFKVGDAVVYVSSPTAQGSCSEYQLLDEDGVAPKPRGIDFVEAAVMPLTFGTAWMSLIEILEIKKGENAGILIINGAGGVGSIATQLARSVLELPVVVTTASRPETIEFSKKMGATHVINHREELKSQIDALELDVPIRYVFILSSTKKYLRVSSEIVAPMGKIATVVQDPMTIDASMPFMGKSLSLHWVWLGTHPFHQVKMEALPKMMGDLGYFLETGKIKCHLVTRLPLTAEGIREGHRLLASGKAVGKVGFGIKEDGMKDGDAFA